MALVPTLNSNSGSGFESKGTVDWVAVADTTFTASLAVFGRLSASGLEPLTVAIAQQLSFHLPIGINGEQQLNDAVSSLKSFSLCGDLLWIGTGVRHILRTLITTSQGASSVTLAACLCEGHTSRFAASVVYEMTNLLGVPRNISPSLDQWCKYTQMCSGIFNSTTFSRRVRQFAVLLYGTEYNRDRMNVIDHGGWNYTDLKARELAKALLAIGGLQADIEDKDRKTLTSIEIFGYQECCWIATFCDFILGLPLRISRTYDDAVIFENFDAAKTTPKLYIRFMLGNGNGKEPLSRTSKVYKLGSGNGLPPNILSLDSSKAPPPFESSSQLDIRFPRETMISDAFKQLWVERFMNWDSLFAQYFIAATAICCNGPLGRRYASVAQFIELAVVSLPELGTFQEAFEEKAKSTAFVFDAGRHYVNAVRNIEAWCRCSQKVGIEHMRSCKTIAMWDTIFQMSVLLGELILDEKLDVTRSGIQFMFSDALGHLSSLPHLETEPDDSDDHRDISHKSVRRPTRHAPITGAREIYRNHPARSRSDDRFVNAPTIVSRLLWFGRSEAPTEGSLQTDHLQFQQLFVSAVRLFSSGELKVHFLPSISAVSGNGLYCYLDILREPSDQYSTASCIHIGRGTIESCDRQYNAVYDQDEDRLVTPRYSPLNDANFSTMIIQYSSYVEENETLRYWYEIFAATSAQKVSVNPVHLLECLAKATSYKAKYIEPAHWEFMSSESKIIVYNDGSRMTPVSTDFLDTLEERRDLYLEYDVTKVGSCPDGFLRCCLHAMYSDNFILLHTSNDFRRLIMACVSEIACGRLDIRFRRETLEREIKALLNQKLKHHHPRRSLPAEPPNITDIATEAKQADNGEVAGIEVAITNLRVNGP